MITQKPMRTTANEGIVSGGKAARACESCLESRARWFCPADDAFLCHSCDSSVHSANDLAARHNRVPLQTPPLFQEPTNNIIDDDDVITSTTTPANQPTWHQGFQKKARTPRHHPKKEHMKKKKKKKKKMNMMMVVPEMSGDEEEESEEEDEHMVFSVPTFDPFDHHHEEDISNLFGFEGIINDHDHDHQKSSYWDSLLVFDDHDHDHVESLLLEGTDEDQVVCNSSSTVPYLITTSRETGSERPLVSGGEEEGVVKVEEEEDGIESGTCEDEFDFCAMELENEVLMNNNNLEVGKGNYYGGKNEEEGKKEVVERELMEEEERNVEMEGNKNKRRNIVLRLNYEEVINSWFGSSPWTTGCRPEFDLDRDGWPNCMGGVDPMNAHYQGWGVVGERKYANGGDDGREARVSRYREKRRTRLFSKKIRYEVRKLNAEKRPRLKGRFVKRTSLTPQH